MRIGSYGNRPTSAREQRTWLSPSDAVRAFIAAMTTTAHTAVFYALSPNTARWWDLEFGAAVGFVPQDDAAQWGSEEHIDANLPQGGIYATPEYSTEPTRR